MPAAIYTAAYGGYDVFKDPVLQDVDCDFLCFTDRPIETATRWRVVVRPMPALHHPRMQAKWFKLMNHKIFPNGRLGLRYGRRLPERRRYDATIWVDASLSIRGGAFAREVSCLTRDGAVAVYAHPDRDCIYDETDVSLTMPKYRNLPLRAQVEAYRRDGHPSHAGLYACGIIGRKAPGSPLRQSFDTAWWHENERWTYHDHIQYRMRHPGPCHGHTAAHKRSGADAPSRRSALPQSVGSPCAPSDPTHDFCLAVRLLSST